jgi:MFS transporter, DHA1 family, inner membrane transport protein
VSVNLRLLSSERVPGEARDVYRLDRNAGLLTGAFMGSVFPFVGVLARERLHAPEWQLSLMAAAPFLGALAALFYANAMEGKPKLPFVIRPALLGRLLIALCVFAVSPLWFALLVGGAQLLMSIGGPAYAAVMKQVYPDRERGRIMSFTRVALMLTQSLIALPVGFLLKYGSFGDFAAYRYVFPIAACFGIAGSLVFSRIGRVVPETASHPDEDARGHPLTLWGVREHLVQRLHPTTLRQSLADTWQFLIGTFAILRTDRAYRWFAMSVFVYGFGNLMLVPLYPIWQVDRLGLSTDSVGLLVQLQQITGLFAYFYWGRFVDRRGPLLAVIINTLVTAAVPLVYLASRDAWTLAPAYLFMGIANAGIDLAYFNSILMFASERTVSRYQALHSFLLGVRGSIAPFAGAGMKTLADAGGVDLKWLFLFSAVIIGIGALLQAAGLRAATWRMLRARVAAERAAPASR